MDGEDITSDGETGGLDSSEGNVPLYTVNGATVSRQTLISQVNKEEFLDSVVSGEINVTINNDDELTNLLVENIENYKESQAPEEEESRDNDIITKNEIDSSNPTKSVEKESLVPITTENKNINFNPTLTNNLVNPAVNTAIEELGSVWENHVPLNIESAFRDEDLNNKVGGHSHSYHLHGMAIDLTGPSSKEFLNWVNNTAEGKKWANKWTEGAGGGPGIIIEDEGGPREHVHVQFKRNLGNRQSIEDTIHGEFHNHEHLDPEFNPPSTKEELINDLENRGRFALSTNKIDNGFDITDLLYKSHAGKESNIPNLKLSDISHLLDEDEKRLLNHYIKGSEDFKGNPTKYLFMPVSSMKKGEYWKQWWGDVRHPNDKKTYFNIIQKVEEKINQYLTSGWEHLGNSEYKHTETGVVISPDMTGGANPLLASSSALPELINQMQSDPNFLKDINSDGIAENFNGGLINQLYEKFNLDNSTFLKGEIESISNEDKKQIKKSEYDLKAGQFTLELFDNLSKSMEGSKSMSEINRKTEQIGEEIILAEQWLKEQLALINDFPTLAHGPLDTRGMKQSDLNRYNKLVSDFNNFRNTKYAELILKRENHLKGDNNVLLLDKLINGYNSSLNYLMSTTDEPVYKKRQDKLLKRRNASQKAYNESTWLGKGLRNISSVTLGTLGNFVESISSIPQQAKGIFSYENEYDMTDKIAGVTSEFITKNMEEAGTSWLYKPTSLTNSESMGNVYYANVEDGTIIFDSNNEIKNIITKDNYVINPESDRYANIIKEYENNKESYPTQKKKEWGGSFYNLAHATTDFILDMTIAKRVGGGTKKLTNSARAGKFGFYAGLYGATNIRMYNMYYAEGIRQGMLPGDASDMASQASLVSSVIEIATPDFGMINPSVKRMATNKALDAISDRVGKDVVDAAIKRGIVNSVFSKKALKYGVIEGGEELAQGAAVDLIKDQWWNKYEFDTKFNVNDALEEFTIGAIIGSGATAVTDVSSSFNKEYIKSGMYKDGMYHAYTNQEDTFKAIDNQIGKEVMVGGKLKTFTKNDAKKLKDGLKNKFKTMENLIGKTSLSDLSKRELLNLVEYKQNAEGLQGSLNKDVQEEVKKRIEQSDKAINRILKNEDPVKVMYDLSSSIDFEVREYVGNFMDISRLGIGTKALIRRITKGDSLTESQQKDSLDAIKRRITTLDAQENLNQEQKSELALLKKLEKDVTNIKTIKDEKIITRGRGKTRGASRGTKGTSIREDITEADTEQDRTTLNQNIGKPVSYKGKQGILDKNKNGEFVLKTPGRGKGIKIKDAGTGRKRLSTVGLKYEGKKVSVDSSGQLNIDGKDTGNILGFSKNDTGSLNSIITLDNQYSEEIKNKAIKKFNSLQKQRNQGKITTQQFNEAVSKTKGLTLQSNNSIKFGAAAGKITNDILSAGNADVISMKDVEQMIEEAIDELGYETEQNQQKEQDKKPVDKKKKSKKEIKQQKRVINPLFDSVTDNNIDSLIDEYSKYEGEVYDRKVKVLKIVKKLYNSLGFNVTIHKDEASLREFFASNGVNLSEIGRAIISEEGIDGGTPEIHINLDIANPNTMFHESAHPFITSLIKMSKTNPEIKKVLDGIKKDLESIEGGKYMKFAKLGYAKGKGGALLRDTDVKDKDISNPDKVLEEAMAEFLADAGLKKFDENQSTLNKAKSYIQSIIKYLLGVDTNAPLNLTLNDLSEITNLDDVTKIFTQATSRGLNINEKKRGKSTGEMKSQYNIDDQFKSHKENGGSTYNNFFGNVSGPYAMVGIFPELGKIVKGGDVTKKELEEYRAANQELLDMDNHVAVGTWYDSESNQTYLDISVAIPIEMIEEAKQLGREYNQKAIFNLQTFEDVSTGGTGETVAQGDATINERIQTIKDLIGQPDVKNQRVVTLGGSGFSSLNTSIKFSDITHGTPKQWLKELKKYGGSNLSQEIKFMGIKDFLDSVERSYPDGIPRVAVEDYIKMHQTSMQFSGNTMSVTLDNETLADVDYEVVSNDVGEKVLFIKNIKAPNSKMMSNIAPVVRNIISFASTENYNGIAFESGDAFKGPRAEFFDSVIPEVVNDIMQSIDSKAGPVLSEVGGQAKTTIEITSPVVSVVEDMLNPSKDTEYQDGFNNNAKTIYSTEYKNQLGGQWLKGTSDFFSDFSFRRELLPMGNIPKKVFDMEWRYKSKIKAEKFKLLKLVDRMRSAIEENQKSNNPIPLRVINDVLSDPTVKIQELESEIKNYEYDLENLDRDGKTYAAGAVIDRIREVEEQIKSLKENHVGKATMKDLESAPELQKLIKQVRRKVDSLSRKLKDVVADKLGVVLDKNMGIYINRQYRIHNDQGYKKKMLKAINALIKAKADPKKIEKVVKRYGKEADLIQSSYEFIRKTLANKYKKKYKNENEITEEQILLDIKRMFSDGPESSDFMKAVNRANDVNTGVFKQREDLPDAISNLFSEAKNPLFNIVSTLTKQTSELEALEFKANAVAAMEGSLVYREDNLPPELSDTHRYPVTLKFSDAVYYTTKEVKEFIDGEVYNPTGAYRIAQVMNGAIKLGKTVYSLKTHVRNFLGNMYFASINGHFSYSDMKESFNVMQNLFDKSTTQEREQMFATMIENGIIDSVYADELQDIMRDGDLGIAMTELFDSGMDMDKVKKRKPGLLKKINTLVNKAYLWEDVIWKGAGFISEVDLFQRAGYERTEAIKMAADNVRGGYTTYSLVPKVGKRIRRMLLVGDFISFPAEVLRTGIGSLKVANKMIRSGNPVLQRSGYKRLFGTVFAWSTLPHLYTGIAALFASAIGMLKDFTDDDDEGLADNPLMDYALMNEEQRDIDKEFTLYDSYSDWFDNNHGGVDFNELKMDDITRDKMIQLFLPSYMKYGDVKLVSAQLGDEGYFDGTYYVWNSSDNMSNNVITRVINAIINTPEDDPTFDKIIKNDVINSMLETFFSPSMMFQILEDLSKREKQSGGKLDDTTDDWFDRLGNSITHVVSESMPGIGDQIYDMMESWQPELFLDEDEMDRKKSPVHETMSMTGFRFSRFNLQENLNFKVRDVSNTLKKLDPEGDGPKKIKREVERQMNYLDKLYTYSEALGIEERGVTVKDRNKERVLSELGNRDSVISMHIQGFSDGNMIYNFLNRDKRVYKNFNEWMEAQKKFTYADLLKSWQQEELSKERDPNIFEKVKEIIN